MSIDITQGMLSEECDADGNPCLSDVGLQYARSLVNDAINEGQGSGVHVELLSCFDLDVQTETAPPHTSGVRSFLIRIDSTEADPRTHFVWLHAAEPGSDHIRVPVGALLGRVAKLEREMGDIDGVAGDMATAAGRSALLEREGRSTAGLLRGVERNSNGQLDALRALAADPATWPLIGAGAVLAGAWECRKKEPDA
ncbi:hypothetical protein ACFPME_11135 [Rhodanobacter umsongensis]|uniref:Uncharacterized protein n=1 Tax=Rhodanobacter umsongensis TaxID=633153 RepID=A0ABW0JMX9_9GAMM